MNLEALGVVIVVLSVLSLAFLIFIMIIKALVNAAFPKDRSKELAELEWYRRQELERRRREAAQNRKGVK